MATRLDRVAHSGLSLAWELDLNYVTQARYAQLVVELGLEHVSFASWATERMTLEGLFDHALSTLRDRTERAAVLDLSVSLGEECIAHLSLEHDWAYVRLAARSVDTLAAAKAWLRERYPEAQPEEEQRIGLTFWMSPGLRLPRTIDVPTWAEIAGNYPAEVALQLDGLLAPRFRPEHGGQLILWHGAPGTGKTWALRALGWEWRSWCSVHYVTDPESFFGGAPKYMLDVLLKEDDDDGDENRWRLLVLEDTGELLAADAKERTGQGLSRLLNVVDGLIGQGLRVIVLVTTNEPLGRLHPAVSRPGRCAAQIEFVPFSAEEAGEWLERHGDTGADREATLATLFARSAGHEIVERRNPIGFA